MNDPLNVFRPAKQRLAGLPVASTTLPCPVCHEHFSFWRSQFVVSSRRRFRCLHCDTTLTRRLPQGPARWASRLVRASNWSLGFAHAYSVFPLWLVIVCWALLCAFIIWFIPPLTELEPAPPLRKPVRYRW